MPAPLVAAGIMAGASLLGQGINAASTARQNRLQREWNEKMYATQRADALADWNMQNTYDSPIEQMKRLDAAGLNPHLVYGNGAASPSSAVRSSQVESWKPQAPQFDIGSAAAGGLGAYYDVQLKDAQVNNLAVVNENLRIEGELKAAQIIEAYVRAAKTSQDTETGKFDLELKRSMRDLSINAVQLQNRKLLLEGDSIIANTQLTLNEDERRSLANAVSVEKMAEEIKTIIAARTKIPYEIKEINARVDNLLKDGTLKEFDIESRKKGIFPGTPTWWQGLQRLLIRGKGSFQNPITSDMPGHRNQGMIPMPFPTKD